MNDFNDKYKLLDIENICFTLFIIASIIDIFANEDARKLYLKNEKLTNDLRDQYLLASIFILIVFIVFFLRNLNNLNKLTEKDKEYPYAYARFIGSLLIVIGQSLTIYYYWNTTNFDNPTKRP